MKGWLKWFWIVSGVILIGGVCFVLYLNDFYERHHRYENAFTLGEKYFESAQYERALTEYKRSLPDSRWEVSAEKKILECYEKLNRSTEEISFLEQRRKEKPNELVFERQRLLRIAEIYKNKLNNIDMAEKYYLNSANKFGNPAAYIGLTEIYQMKGDLLKAIQYQENALSKMSLVDSPFLARNKAKNLVVLGNLYSKVNRSEDAKKAFEQALQLDPQNLDAQNELKQLLNVKTANM